MKDVGYFLWSVAAGGAMTLTVSLVAPEHVGNAVIIMFAIAAVYEALW